jgi:alpha-L-rhamnosidase
LLCKGSTHQHGSCAWGDAATIIPWTLYVQYGDIRLLEEQFENMRMWVDYIKEQDDLNGSQRLWKSGFHYADWLGLDNPDKDSCLGGTDSYYVASAYYYHSVCLTAKAARVLGKSQMSRYYMELASEIKQALQREYFTETGRIAIGTQTAMVLALYMEFVPEQYKDGLITDLKHKLDNNSGKLTTGFVGTIYLCQVLSEYGLQDYAYNLLLNEEYPGWLYCVNLGATTMWERWDSVLPDGKINNSGMNSLNHYAYGSILNWMYRYMCGINPLESAAGFRSVVIKPQVDFRLQYAKAEYLSASGLYQCGWRIEGERVIYHIAIPFNAEAEFIVDSESDIFIINGVEYEKSGEKFLIQLKAGEYEIVQYKH